MKALYINLQILAIGLISSCLVLISCSTHEHAPKTSNIYKWSGSKTDYHKAALLNVEMGEKYLAEGQISRAKKKLLHAIEIEPNLPEAHTALGYYYESVGDLKDAEYHYRKAVVYGKGKGGFYNNYGTFLCREKRYKEAEKAFLGAIADKRYAKTAEVYENVGLCSLRGLYYSKAEKYLTLALRHDPYRAVAPLELSSMYFNQDAYQDAIAFLKKYQAHHEPTARSLWLSIQINRKLNNQDALASDILLLKNMFKHSPEYKLYLESIENS